MESTLPETNVDIAPENRMLEDEFPFGMAYFQRRTVSFREWKCFFYTLCPWGIGVVWRRFQVCVVIELDLIDDIWFLIHSTISIWKVHLEIMDPHILDWIFEWTLALHLLVRLYMYIYIYTCYDISAGGGRWQKGCEGVLPKGPCEKELYCDEKQNKE